MDLQLLRPRFYYIDKILLRAARINTEKIILEENAKKFGKNMVLPSRIDSGISQ